MQTGYNPSHLGGAGDLIESISQGFAKPVSDYDLKTILMQIQPEVTTRKILLVGHSQGSFYTNEMYEYLTAHGVPKESIGVYEIATPASYVAGGGGYVTSSNDKIINRVRDDEVKGTLEIYLNSDYTAGNVIASALRPNIAIPPEDGYDANEYGGHGFSVYMNGASSRIVRGIDSALGRLSAPATDDTSGSCFEAPDKDLSYKTKSILFAAGDTLADAVLSGAQPIVQSALALGHAVSGGLAAGIGIIKTGLAAIGNLGQGASAALAVASPAEPQPSAPATSASQPQPALESSPPSPALHPANPAAPVQPPQPAQSAAPKSATPTQMPPVFTTPLTREISPGYGGGGTQSAIFVQNPVQPQPGQPSPAPASPTTAALAISTPAEGATFATSSVQVSGTADPGAEVDLAYDVFSASTTADSAGAWEFEAHLAEGSTQIRVSAISAGASSTLSRTVTIDTLPPTAPALTSADCDLSLVSGMCVLPASTAQVSWQPVSDASYYSLALNDIPGATSTATQASVSLAADATTSIAVVAYDAAGNAATSSALAIRRIDRPLIINEIGWGGDKNQSHQWIELKNLTPYSIDLTHVSLARSGGDPIPLSGTLPAANPYFVVEPVDVAFTGFQKLVTPFPLLSTSGEQLSLTWNGATLDSTPPVSTCGGWCAGALQAQLGSNILGINDLFSPLSMERASDASDGTLKASWHTTDSYGPWISANNLAALWGTPGSANSLGLPAAGVYCGSESNILTPDSGDVPFNPGTDGCTFLMRFITGDDHGEYRVAGMYEGEVASSTGGMSFLGRALASHTDIQIPAGTPSGTHFFFVISEQRNWDITNDGHLLDLYLTKGVDHSIGIDGPPHGNYYLFPFTYDPTK